MALPPLPPGFVLERDPKREDPWVILQREGFTATNGFRTEADVERIRAQGYKPASNGAHNRGDGIDLDHPRLSAAEQARRLKELFGDWPGMAVLDEGHHRHMALPGWGAAPGTPGTANSGLPALPPGFELEQRGALKEGNFVQQDEIADRLATLDQGLAAGDVTPEEHARWTASVRAEGGRPALSSDNPAQMVDTGGVVLFKDEQPEGPATKLAVEDEQTLLRILAGGDIQGARRFRESKGVFGEDNFAEVVAALRKGARLPDFVQYELPTAMQSDGAAGALARGIGDPFNLLDETGAVVDTLGLTPGRESIWNSDRPAKDVLYSNIDLNRATLKADEREQFTARLGGQLATSMLLPIGNKARSAGQLARYGAAEGAAAGFGAGEGNPIERLPNTAGGAAAGGVGGFALGKLIDGAAPLARRFFRRGSPSAAAAEPVAVDAGFNAAPVVNDGMQNAGPTSAAKTQPQGGALEPVEVAQPSLGLAPDATGSLWQRSRADLEAMLAEKSLSDDQKLIQALGEEGAKRFKALDRAQNSADPRRADEAARLLDREFGNLTPEQERLVYGIGETEAQADEITELLDARNDLLNGEDADWSAYMAAVAARRVTPEEFAAVIRGEGSVPAQAAFVRMGQAYQNLSAAGVPTDQVPGRMVDALVERGGWSPDQADEFVFSFVRGMDALKPASASRAAPGLPATRSAEMRIEDAGSELIGSVERPRDYLDLPPLPPGATLLDDPALGRVRPIDQQASAADLAAAARGVMPEDVLPGPTFRPLTQEKAEAAADASWRDVPTPRLGRTPRKPSDVVGFVKGWVRDETSRKGLPVRIDAEDAINKGVPAELIYSNPTVADRSKLRLRNPSIFGTKYGAMTGSQQVLRSLDSLGDGMDPVAWGFDNLAGAGRLEPEDIGSLIARGLEGDEGVLNRADPAFGPWSEYQERAAQRAEFDALPDGPPVERLGKTATSDDIDAIPFTAYEELLAPGGRASNIDIGKLETRSDIRRALQNVEAKFGGFDAARRGKITQGETEALAAELRMTPADLLQRRKGQALNAEQALAARQILAKSADEVTTLARRMGDGPSDEQRAAFARAIVRHAAIQEQVSGATAEAGRALAQFKMAAKSRAVSGRIHEAVIQGMGGPGKLEDIAAGILDLQRGGAGPGQVNSFTADAIKPGFKDKLVELWYNTLLSGPQTHVVNTLSNSLTSVLQIPEQVVASGVGQLRRGGRALAGKPDDFNRVTLSEIGPRLVGLMQGAREGLRNAQRTLITGEVPDFVTKVESRSQKAISGLKGEIIRTPSRLLASEDEFFKAVARRMDLNAQAARLARKEGLRGAEFRSRMEALTANPPADMLERSLAYARYLTFQKPLGKVGQRISATTQEHPWLKLFVPFIRTPTNILKFSIERSPLAPVLKEVREAYQRGGEDRALAISRMMLGTGLGLTIAQMANDGLITGGGPADRGALDMKRADGWQPYSLKIGNKYHSYQRLDPLAITLGVAADLVDYGRHMTDPQREQAGALLVASVMRNLGNKTWLSGVSDVVEAMDDPQRNGGRVIGRLAGSIAVPAVVAQTARTADPVQRDTAESSLGKSGLPWIGPTVDKMIGSIQGRLPGLSIKLPARRDVFGEEVRSEGGVGPDIASPIWVKEAKNDPIIAELLQLSAKIGRPSRKVSGRKLSPAEYDQYQQLSGRYIRDDLADLISDAGWQAMDAEQRIKAVDKVKRDAREDAREDLAFDAPSLPPGFHLVQ